MAEFLIASAALILATVAAGLARTLRGPGDADRMMAAQLLGTGGIAALLLLAVGTADPPVADVGLGLALLAAVAAVAFAEGAAPPGSGENGGAGPQ